MKQMSQQMWTCTYHVVEQQRFRRVCAIAEPPEPSLLPYKSIGADEGSDQTCVRYVTMGVRRKSKITFAGPRDMCKAKHSSYFIVNLVILCQHIYTKAIVRPVKKDWAVLSKDIPLDISIKNR